MTLFSWTLVLVKHASDVLIIGRTDVCYMQSHAVNAKMLTHAILVSLDILLSSSLC